ncbi:hypothetical protein ACFYOT_14540 [Saccharothrix saharensis]|uniref:hypothetical protein n=1 Tax=Saccharothrix saharensis TaxID=571190 RepID=UPI0036BE2359
MDAYGLEDHPDLNDAEWIREATRRAEREARANRPRRRRRPLPRLSRGRGRAVAAVALVAVMLGGVAAWSAVGPDRSQPAAWTGVDLERPFTGTPAEGWADGEAGVVAPPAEAVGGFTADEVAQAYERVRRAVIASRLDRRVVERHDVEPFLGLLAPDLQDHMRPLFDGRHDVEATMVVTRVATGWPLLPAAPKVNGSMRAEAGGPGELVVHTNYVFAYAFAAPEPGRLTGPLDIVAMNRVVLDYVVRSGPDVRDTSLGLWTDQASGFTYSMSCDAIDRGFLAPSIADPGIDGPTVAEREPEEYFDPTQPLSTEDGCVD